MPISYRHDDSQSACSKLVAAFWLLVHACQPAVFATPFGGVCSEGPGFIADASQLLAVHINTMSLQNLPAKEQQFMPPTNVLKHCRHTMILSTSRPPLWRSCIALPPWLSHKLSSPFIIPTDQRTSIIHAILSLFLKPLLTHVYAMALLASLMLSCTSRSTSAFCLLRTHLTWLVGSQSTFLFSNQCSY